ncbi:MAG: methanethiol S-methyltransferase, partial [Gemmatimonadota bacterium]
GFVGNLVVPRSIDGDTAAGGGSALLINILLLSLFAVQHSVMARQWFKRAWTKIVPRPVERSTFVLFASVVLAFLMWQWRPMTGTVWNVEGSVGEPILQVTFWLGWGMVLLATFLIDHFELFGLKQVWLHLRGEEYRPPSFATPFFYKRTRHPLYLGFMIAFWSAPHMTTGHLLFALMTTGWMLVAIQFEERDLLRFHGQAYVEYRERVRMLLPLRRR